MRESLFEAAHTAISGFLFGPWFFPYLAAEFPPGG